MISHIVHAKEKKNVQGNDTASNGDLWCIPSLPLLPGSLWPSETIPVKFLSMQVK